MNMFMDFLLATEDKKHPVSNTISMYQFPTGFMYLDYGVGSYLTVLDDDEVPQYVYHNVGITSGSVNVLISKSQGGKTSLAIAMGVAIIEPFINNMYYRKFYAEMATKKEMKGFEMEGYPFIQILDTEKTLPLDYVKKLSHYTNKLLKNHAIISQITTDKDLIKAMEKHIRYKVNFMKRIPMPMRNLFGSSIMEYPPTVVIIDSASQLLLEDLDDPSKVDKNGGLEGLYDSATKGPAGAQRAKTISALYSQLVNYAKKYNIIIFSINHINKMPAIMGVPVKQYRGLRAGETIGGGERAIYLASNILRLDVIKSVGGASSSSVSLGDKITGHIAKASWIKSKSNSFSNTCELVYTNVAGYDQLLSTLWMGKETGDLRKSGNYYILDAYPEYKFTLKNCKEVFGDHPEMITGYYDQFRNACEKMLDNPENAEKQNQKLMDKIKDDISKEYESGEISKSDAFDLSDLFNS